MSGRDGKHGSGKEKPEGFNKRNVSGIGVPVAHSQRLCHEYFYTLIKPVGGVNGIRDYLHVYFHGMLLMYSQLFVISDWGLGI